MLGGKKTGDPDRILFRGLGGGETDVEGLLQSLPLTKDMTNTEQQRIQTFQIPFAGVRIRATNVEN